MTDPEALTPEAPPERPAKSIKYAAVIYFVLGLFLLLCAGLFAAIFGPSWLLLAFVPAIVIQVRVGYHYLRQYNAGLNAFEAYEREHPPADPEA